MRFLFINCYLFNYVISLLRYIVITLYRYYVISLLRYIVITLYRYYVISSFPSCPPPYDSGLNAIVARCSALRSAMS